MPEMIDKNALKFAFKAFLLRGSIFNFALPYFIPIRNLKNCNFARRLQELTLGYYIFILCAER